MPGTANQYTIASTNRAGCTTYVSAGACAANSNQVTFSTWVTFEACSKETPAMQGRNTDHGDSGFQAAAFRIAPVHETLSSVPLLLGFLFLMDSHFRASLTCALVIQDHFCSDPACWLALQAVLCSSWQGYLQDSFTHELQSGSDLQLLAFGRCTEGKLHSQARKKGIKLNRQLTDSVAE